MPIATPTPYKNINRLMEDEEMNATHLEEGVNDARARLKAASEQYKARPGAPEEAIRNKAAQDLIERINAVERAKSRAKEIEIKNKSKVKTKDSLDEQGNPVIEFPEMDVEKKKPKPSMLQAIMNAFAPSAGAATVSEAKGAPESHHPMVAPQEPTLKAAQVIQGLRAAGVGSIGDKAQVEQKDQAKTTTTNPLLLDENDINTIGNAIRKTPEWQRQEQGLDDIESLIALEAQSNAKKNSVDLSPLGAYLDYQNTLRGTPTELAKSLKMAPVEDTTLKDMGEIQRRRADLSKELINTVKASKMGQVVTQDGQVIGYAGGITPNNLPMQMARMRQSDVAALKRATDTAFKDNDEQLKIINSVAERIKSNTPSEIGALRATLEVMDTGSKRILAGILGMEAYDQALDAEISQWFKTKFSGTLTPHSQKVLLTRMQNAAARARQERAAKEADLREYAKSLRALQPGDVENLVGSHSKMTKSAYPTATEASTASDPNKMKAEFDQFKKMMQESGR
jgi:hypothetical protein